MEAHSKARGKDQGEWEMSETPDEASSRIEEHPRPYGRVSESGLKTKGTRISVSYAVEIERAFLGLDEEW